MHLLMGEIGLATPVSKIRIRHLHLHPGKNRNQLCLLHMSQLRPVALPRRDRTQFYALHRPFKCKVSFQPIHLGAYVDAYESVVVVEEEFVEQEGG